jgi:hypothetical protein
LFHAATATNGAGAAKYISRKAIKVSKDAKKYILLRALPSPRPPRETGLISIPDQIRVIAGPSLFQ